MQRPAFRRSVSRLQQALLKIGLYSGNVDGSIGPSTSGAFQSFVNQFAPQAWDSLDEYNLAAIEQISIDGFRSEQERQSARDNGFLNAAAMSEARAAGFETEADFAEARRSGFDRNSDFQQFKISGFSSKPDFDLAKKQGFVSKSSYQAHQEKLQVETASRASDLLEDAEQYLRINPQTPNIVEIASSAAALNAALDSRKLQQMAAHLDELTRHLSQVSGFDAFAKTRADERISARRNKIAELKNHLESQRAAVRLWMAQNLMHEATADLADEVITVGKAIDGNDLEKLEASGSSLSELLTRWKLKPQIDKLVASSGEIKEVPQAPEYMIAQTDSNFFLLNGSGEERVALYNASSSSPSIIRNLVGNFVFEKRTARICLVPAISDPALARAIAKKLEGLDAERIDISRSPCSADNILSYDVMLLTRRDFLKSETGFALRVLNLLESKDLRAFPALSDSDLRREQSAEKSARESISRDVAAGLRNGFGALVVTAGAGNLCVVAQDTALEHDEPVAEVRDFVQSETRKRLATVFSDAEATYRATQRRECLVVYASAPDLKLISEALLRDGRAYEFLPLWFEAETISRIKEQKLLEIARIKSEADTKKLALEEEKKIRVEQEKRRKADAVEKEKGLREKNGAVARALQSRLTDGLERIVLSRTAMEKQASVDQFISEASMMFPDFIHWNSKLKDELWVAKDLTTDVVEYGTGTWGKRQLEQIALQVKVDLESAQRGEKRTQCFQLGVLVDDEFKRYRDGFEIVCSENDAEAFVRWKTLHNFESRWRAN